jgi:MoaA/NifB/PqqE/SkfB family radical SAM enzyme
MCWTLAGGTGGYLQGEHMIRIRFPIGTHIPSWLEAGVDGVEVTHDQRVITAESEKNGELQFKAVNHILRPIFEEQWSANIQRFSLVSIETQAGCNFTCSFCPVSRLVDPRKPGELPWQLLEKVAQELAELAYTGRISLFGNNEPLLDERLPRIVRLFRSACPRVDLRVLTNGTRASRDLVIALFESGLSVLIINNYTDGLRLIGPVKALIRAAAEFHLCDIRVSVRSRTDTLTTRAGLAPNKPTPAMKPHGFCALPFTDLHISYTGDVNLCCFDAHGRVSMGNIATMPIHDIWRSSAFGVYRQRLLQSVRAGLCSSCDFDGFRDPLLAGEELPLTRDEIAQDLEDET